MKRFTTWYISLVVLGATNVALGRSPIPIDPPTPPPCAADGTCYPRTCEWGWYPARWRTWPGAELTPTPSGAAPTPADDRVSPELSHSETPPAELEDAAAPPGSPRRDAQPDGAPAGPPIPGESTPNGGGTGLPDVPLPNDENAPLGPPTTNNDPPPALPFTTSSSGHTSGNRQAAIPASRRLGSSRVSTGDPPPTPPWMLSVSL